MDATIVQAPSSTRNRDKQRDPELRQTKKGQQWYFGMKAHIWVDLESGLLHRQERTVYADAGYQGADKRAPKRGRTWYIAAKPVPSPLHHIRIPDLGISRAFSGAKSSAFQARFRYGCFPA